MEIYASTILFRGGNSMRTLHLTNQQFDVLYHILEDTVNDIEEDIVSDTVTYQIYQQLIHLNGGKSND